MTTGPSTDPPRISDREAEVQAALGDGLSNAQIAGRMHISVRTVESHVSSLLRKYGVTGRRELAALAVPAGRPPAPALMDGVPPSVTSFVGRTGELETVLALITNGARLISLLGPGGMGKSRLAAMAVTVVAASFPCGGAFVDLVPVRPDSVTEAVAAALGVTEQPEQALTEAILDTFGPDRRLLVLDSCEHLLEPVTALIGQVLTRCPGTTVLATSRERLAVPGEHCVQIGPLPVQTDAVRLFADRAAAVDPGTAAAAYTAAGQAADVAAICARLDGMPLAIELAAARSAALGVAGLAAALDDSLRLLAGGRDIDERHRSLRAVIDWSHALLDPAERALFRRLSVFAESFDLAAATAITPDADYASTADVLGRLTDKSLIVRSRDSWRLLDTIRAFAAEQLAATGDVADTTGRHLRWAAGIATELESRLSGPWRQDFDALAGDLRKALASTPATPDELAHTLARSFAHLCYARRFVTEALGLFEQAALRAPGPRLAARDLSDAAGLVLVTKPISDESATLLAAAAEQLRTAGEPSMCAIMTARAVVATRRWTGCHFQAESREQMEAALAEALAAADPATTLATAHVTVARAWNARDGHANPDLALSAAAVDSARLAGDPVLLLAALDAQALAADNAGLYREAHRLAAERLALLPALSRDDPYAAAEIIDALQMAPRAAIAVGSPAAALAAVRLAQAADLAGPHSAFPASLEIVPLALAGQLTDALRCAAIVWEAKTAYPARFISGWLAVDMVAASLACGLLGDTAGFSRWRRRTRQVYEERRPARDHGESFEAFTDARVALAAGRTDDAAALADRAFGDFAYKHHAAYARAAGAELAVVAMLPAAADLVSALAADAKESDWAQAAHLRATGRLHGDTDALLAACGTWERIGARYERAATLLLIPDRAAEGRAELDAIGVRPPG